MKRIVAAVFIQAFLSPMLAAAQVPALPEAVEGNSEVACGSYANPAVPLERLRDAYLRGQWKQLQALTRQILNECKFVSPKYLPGLFIDGKPVWNRDHYLVAFGASGANDEPIVIKYLVHDPDPSRYATTLPGVPETLIDVASTNGPASRLVQIYLSQNAGMRFISSVQSKPLTDPVTDQTPDFLKAAVDPGVIVPLLKGIIAPRLMGAAPSPGSRSLLATVSIVPVTFRRGELTFSDVIKAPAFLDEKRGATLRAGINALALDIRADDKYSAVSKNLSATLFRTVDQYITTQAPLVCEQTNFAASCWTALDAQIQKEAGTFCTQNGGSACTTGEPSIVLARYRAAAAEPAVPSITSTSTFKNVPRQVVSFGLISAFVLRAVSTHDRVKVDGEKIVADPLGRALNLVTVNVHPPFDASSPDLTTSERWRVFVGSAVTPNFGLTVGGGVGLWRNISINGGYALLAIPTLRSGDVLNTAPKSATTPFKVGAAHIAFVGLGYKLK